MTSTDAEHRVGRPVCRTKPTATLLQHAEKAALPSQTKAINEFHAAEAAKRAIEHISTSSPTDTAKSPSPMPSTPSTVNTCKRVHPEDSSDGESADDERENARTNPKPRKQRKLAVVPTEQESVDADGANGKVKKHRKCKMCLKACILVNEISTLHRHAEAKFSGKYREWAKEHLFESMLPGDVKARKDNAAQQSINAHLTEWKLAEKVVSYLDKLFKQAAIKWLVATDQPIQALETSEIQRNDRCRQLEPPMASKFQAERQLVQK
ncbi:hypothetical protein DFJ58DRAFT_846224 [Suillus subalutaceus]|uniref:uncharacterized protein n=1 Tax=Suillus subalutaceus TaxID=48586 RepID=UPI001B880D26|nr:uncharacterized protein DFJ58DRAFT_846224 [Suillus subalutaceus]KAG1838015.1 hypothetical protein DFJ58DRAFT_846224 [Suillus subalutaceus]